MAKDQKRVLEELIEQRVLQKNIEYMEPEREASSKRLRQIYAKGIIHEKYRNLVMVSSLYEYLCTGRCYTLEGHEGGYNILEMEMRLDRIITQLDKIIWNLEQIRNNQHTLYNAVKEGNRQSERIMNETMVMAQLIEKHGGTIQEMNSRIDVLQQHSEMNAYYTKQVQKELDFMNYVNEMTGRTNGYYRGFNA